MKLILLNIMLLISAQLHAQSNFQLDHRSQILTENITNLALDSMGYLWIGTTDGILRYDGHDMRRFQNEGLSGSALNGNYVYDILPRPDSSVWVATYGGGISIYHPYQNKFKTLLSSDIVPSIQENRVTGIHELSKDSVLVYYRGIDFESGGFSLLDNDGKLIGHYLDGVVQEDGFFVRFVDLITYKSDIWALAMKLYHLDKQTLNYKSIALPFTVKEWDSMKAIEFDGHSNLFIGSINGLYKYNIEHNEWSTILENVHIKSIKLHHDKIFVLSRKNIYVLDEKSERITKLLEASFIKNNNGLRMNDFEITDEDLWLGSNQGLFRFDLRGQPVKMIKLTSETQPSLRSLKKMRPSTEDNYGLYIAYDGQILKENDANQLQLLNKVGGRVHGIIADFLNPGKYLIASDDGLYQYDAHTNQTSLFIEGTSLAKILDNESIWSIYNNEQDSILWIGTRSKGLIKYNVAVDTFINFKQEKGNPESLCFNRYLFRISRGLDGNLWISTDKGLSVINPETNQFIYYPKIMDLLSDYIVHHNIAGDRYMWIGTRDHGLFRYDILQEKTKVYTIRDGLPFTGVNRLIFDQGKLFFSTRKGVGILEESSDKIRLFDETSGIDDKDLYYCKLSIEEDFLWVSGGSSNKIYQIPIDEINNRPKLNPVLIESIKVSTSDSTISYYYPKDHLNLTAKEDNLVITFTNVDFDNQHINYRYQLEGYDDRWIVSGTSRTANYSHLPGGSYQLYVQASLVGGSWEQESTIKINIDNYWYQTKWFYTLCILGGVLFIGYLYKVSLDKIKLKKSYDLMLSQAEMKALRAQMNPHFVFNSLNSIKSFIIENDRKNASDYLNKFSKLMRLILNHSKSNLISLSEEIQAIRLYIDMERLRFSSFDFELDIDETIVTEHLSVPPMIIQPYLENAIWHGLLHKVNDTGKLLLKFVKIDDQGLHVLIRDNGIGREAASSLKSKSVLQKKSHGMTITKERLELSKLHHGRESVKIIDLYESQKAIGTEIQIILPYTKNENEK